jgi:hypothetical protein
MGQHTQKSNLDFEALSAQCSNPKEKRHNQKGRNREGKETQGRRTKNRPR